MTTEKTFVPDRKIKLICYIIGWIISYLFLWEMVSMKLRLSEVFANTSEYEISMYYSIVHIIVFKLLIQKNTKIFYNWFWLSLFHMITIVIYIRTIPKYFYYTTIKGFRLIHGFWGDFKNMGNDPYKIVDIEEKLYAPIMTIIMLIIIFHMIKSIYFFIIKNKS